MNKFKRFTTEDREYVLGGLSSEQKKDILNYYKDVVLSLCSSGIDVKSSLDIDRFALQMMSYYRHILYPRETRHDND